MGISRDTSKNFYIALGYKEISYLTAKNLFKNGLEVFISFAYISIYKDFRTDSKVSLLNDFSKSFDENIKDIKFNKCFPHYVVGTIFLKGSKCL